MKTPIRLTLLFVVCVVLSACATGDGSKWRLVVIPPTTATAETRPEGVDTLPPVDENAIEVLLP